MEKDIWPEWFSESIWFLVIGWLFQFRSMKLSTRISGITIHILDLQKPDTEIIQFFPRFWFWWSLKFHIISPSMLVIYPNFPPICLFIDDFPSYKPSIFRTRNFHGFPLKGTCTEHLDIWWNKNPWGFPLLPKTQRPKPLNNTICCSKINENHHFLEVDHYFSSINGPFYIATDPLGLPASPPGWAWRRWPRRSAGRGKNHWDQDLRKNV